MSADGRNRRNGASRRRDGAIAASVGIVALAVQLPILDRWFSVMDEGHMLLFADLVLKGQRLYSDMTIYPLPGAFYLLGLAFALFEPSILLSRWLVAIEFSVFAALVFLLVRRIVSLPYAGLAVVATLLYRLWSFPHWQMYNYSTTALLFLLGSLVALVAFFDRGRKPTLALAGLLFGLGVFCKQDYGAAALVASLCALVVHARSDPAARLAGLLGWYLGPAAAVGVAAAGHFALQGQLPLVVQMTVFKHFVGLSSYEYQAFPSLFPLFRQDPALRDVAGVYNFLPSIVYTVDWRAAVGSDLFARTALYDTAIKLFIYAPPLFVAAWVAGAVRRRRALRDPERRTAYLAELTLGAFAAAVVALIHLYRPQDYVHTAVLYWPIWCLGVVALHGLVAGRRRRTWLAAALLIVPLGAAVGYSVRLGWLLREMHGELLPGDRAGIRVKPGEAEVLGAVVAYLEEHSEPDEPVAVLPYFSIAHFLAERHGPHAASYILWPFAEIPDRDRRIIEAMEALQTATVVYNFTQFPNFPPVEEYAPELYAYLVERFETDRVFSGGAFGFKLAALRRRAAAVDCTPLEIDPGSSVLEVELPNGARRDVPASARAATLAASTWPFRRVVALRPRVGGRTLLRIPLEVPDAARLRTAVGVHPDAWFSHPPAWVRFDVEIDADGRRTSLFSRKLDPHQVLEDRGWFDVEVSLAPFAGRSVELVLATSTVWQNGETLLMGGFGEPCLTRGGAD